MRQFFKLVFASCLGIFLALILFVLCFGIFAASKVTKVLDGESVSINSNSILKLDLDGTVPEKTDNVEVNPFEIDSDSKVGVSDIVKLINLAKADDDIKGIYINNPSISIGSASAFEIRNALERFKESGKFVVSYGTHYSQKAYYLASVASEILIDPMGEIELKGYAASIPHFKDLMDNLGIQFQVVYAGQFKSATEPFRLNKMSDQNKLQTRELLNAMYNLLIKDISEARKLDKTALVNMINKSPYHPANESKENKLVDELIALDDIDDYLKNKTGLGKDDKLNIVNIDKYYKSKKEKLIGDGDEKIAVVFAEGEIVEGSNQENVSIAGKDYVKIIQKIATDKKVRALVLRVNSPGGSAIASEQILQAINELREESKIPIVVSMGDVAASGGYYIACQADKIYAEPNTITGSIGVFGMIPDFSGLMEKKFKIHFDSVKTGPLAEGVTGVYPLNQPTFDFFQRDVNRVYDVFLERVAKGRKKSRDQIHEIAQGRVWTGESASKNGLVDELGSLQDAIAFAANKAGLKSYRLSEYPKVGDPVTRVLDKYINKKKDETSVNLRYLSKDTYGFYQIMTNISKWNGVQARIPFIVDQLK